MVKSIKTLHLNPIYVQKMNINLGIAVNLLYLPSLYLVPRYTVFSQLLYDNSMHAVTTQIINHNEQQEAQLPQGNSASAAHMDGGGRVWPSSPLPLHPLWLYLCIWSNPKATTQHFDNVKYYIISAMVKLHTYIKYYYPMGALPIVTCLVQTLLIQDVSL